MLAIIDSAEQFENLREEWTELLAQSSSGSVFLTWEWLYTWWKHLADGRKLHLLAVREDTELIALAPLTSPSSKLMHFARLRALEFLGTGSVGSDYLDIIVRRGREAQAMDGLEKYFLCEKVALDLKQVEQGHSFASQLAMRLEDQQWTRSEIVTNVCPFIDLAGHTWDSYQAGLGPKHRYNLRRRLKNINRDFRVSFEAVESEDLRGPVLCTLVALHNERMKDRGGSDGLHSPELIAFHEEFTRVALTRGWLRLFALTLNGVVAAALYGLMYRKKFYFYQSGFDAGYSAHSVGLVTMGLAIKAAIREGAEEFDLLHGDEKYKSLWARQERTLVRAELYPATSKAWMYARAIGLSRLARTAGRASLTLLQSPAGSGRK